MQGIHRLLCKLGQARRVAHRDALRGQSLVLAGLRVRMPQLIELPAQVLFLALSTRAKLLEIAQGIESAKPRISSAPP